MQIFKKIFVILILFKENKAEIIVYLRPLRNFVCQNGINLHHSIPCKNKDFLKGWADKITLSHVIRENYGMQKERRKEKLKIIPMCMMKPIKASHITNNKLLPTLLIHFHF